MIGKNWFAACAVVLGCASAPALAVPVSLELALLTDVSGSVDASEYNLQKNGYVEAFRNSSVHRAIADSELGAIAVAYYEWASAGEFATKVNWYLIDGVDSANAFANLLAGTIRSYSGSTAPQSALQSAIALFGTETGAADNGFESLRQVIDVSGDGERNDGIGGASGRDAALTAGVDAVNGLFIGTSLPVADYYRSNIVGGTNAFAVQARTFEDFSGAILTKLLREIAPPSEVPEPGSAPLLGVAVLAWLAARRRAKNRR